MLRCVVVIYKQNHSIPVHMFLIIADFFKPLQLHIEQGPALEWVGMPLGVVKGIAGQTRLKV